VSAKTKVLVVDDSAVARDLLERGLSLDPEIEVVGKASDAFAARDKIVFLQPDVMTLDVEMPRMDGIEFLKRLMAQHPIPTVVVSAVTSEGSKRALDALTAGAVDVVGKPRSGDPKALRAMISELAEKVKLASKVKPEKIQRSGTLIQKGPQSSMAPRGDGAVAGGARPGSRSPWGKQEYRGIIAIGASTGGTVALHRIFETLPPWLPPIVIVQHMPPVFTRMFAEALARESRIPTCEAENGMVLESGHAYVAPGDLHFEVLARGGELKASCRDGPKVRGHRPSVDMLFSSIAAAALPGVVGVILTGMGKDGADGMLSMRASGARCLAQDESSSVVFGMPREAWEIGAAEKLVPLDHMADEIVNLVAQHEIPGK